MKINFLSETLIAGMSAFSIFYASFEFLKLEADGKLVTAFKTGSLVRCSL